MITRDDIANLYVQVESGTKVMSARDALYALLLMSLSPGQQEAYSLLLEEGSVSSLSLRDKYGWETNYSGNILKQLERYGLAAGDWDKDGVKVYTLPPSGETGS